MLTSSTLGDEVSKITSAIAKTDLDGAKKRINILSQNVKTERERGTLMALNGILVSAQKKKEGSFQSWDEEKIMRAASEIMKSQMIDDFDRGYADALANYAKLLKPSRPERE